MTFRKFQRSINERNDLVSRLLHLELNQILWQRLGFYQITIKLKVQTARKEANTASPLLRVRMILIQVAKTRIIRTTHAVSWQFVSPWRTLAFRSVGYVNVASRGCNDGNREPHRAIVAAQSSLLRNRTTLSDVTVTGELSQEIMKNRASAAAMQRDKSDRRVSSPRYRTDQVRIAWLMIAAPRGSMTVEIIPIVAKSVVRASILLNNDHALYVRWLYFFEKN